MRQRSRMWALIIATNALTAGLALFFAPYISHSVAADHSIKPVRSVIEQKHEPVATMKIVPADVLGTGVVTWMPSTGEN